MWPLWVSNANAPDGVAWFHATHANTQTTAISETEVIAAVRKLLDQTQPGNAEKMGVRITRRGSVWLIVPNALWDAALKLNQTQGSALFHLFGESNQYVLVNALLTDANDWGVCRPAVDVESVRCAFLNGRDDPDFLLADLPQADQGFIGDRFLYKVRFESASRSRIIAAPSRRSWRDRNRFDAGHAHRSAPRRWRKNLSSPLRSVGRRHAGPASPRARGRRTFFRAVSKFRGERGASGRRE